MSERNYYRVLAIPAGADLDAEGRSLGDDWPIANLGEGEDGTRYWVTTDRVHASETPALGDIEEQARVICDALNADARDRMTMAVSR